MLEAYGLGNCAHNVPQGYPSVAVHLRPVLSATAALILKYSSLTPRPAPARCGGRLVDAHRRRTSRRSCKKPVKRRTAGGIARSMTDNTPVGRVRAVCSRCVASWRCAHESRGDASLRPRAALDRPGSWPTSERLCAWLLRQLLLIFERALNLYFVSRTRIRF